MILNIDYLWDIIEKISEITVFMFSTKNQAELCFTLRKTIFTEWENNENLNLYERGYS